MYYPLCGMVHIKEPCLWDVATAVKSSPVVAADFLLLSEWSLISCLTYNRKKYNELNVPLNETFLPFSLL